jgi:hypothetical protein
VGEVSDGGRGFGYFIDQRHCLYVGWVLGTALKHGFDLRPEVDDDGPVPAGRLDARRRSTLTASRGWGLASVGSADTAFGLAPAPCVR